MSKITSHLRHALIQLVESTLNIINHDHSLFMLTKQSGSIGTNPSQSSDSVPYLKVDLQAIRQEIFYHTSY